MNMLDPTVDSDLGGRRNVGNNRHVNGGGVTTSTIGGGISNSTNAGPHNVSTIRNLLD